MIPENDRGGASEGSILRVVRLCKGEEGGILVQMCSELGKIFLIFELRLGANRVLEGYVTHVRTFKSQS